MTYLENRQQIMSITVEQTRSYLAQRGMMNVDMPTLQVALESSRVATLRDVWSTPERVLQGVVKGMEK